MPRSKKTTTSAILNMEKTEGDIIRSMIQSACDESKNKMIEESHHQSKTVLLENLGDYLEEPFTILQSYFEGKGLDRLTRHQIESYNNFVNYQMQKTIEMFNPIVIKSENDYDPDTGEYGLVINLNITNLKFYPPQIYENNGATKLMMPQEARLRNFTYASSTTVDLYIEYHVRDTDNQVKVIENTMPQIRLCSLPIMLKSSICILTQYKNS